jgi:RNA polymerase sigma-70 factor (ECF subfamily)
MSKSAVASAGRTAESTLGDLLYGDASKPRVAEDDWVGLVRAIAAGDKRAVDQLFERTHHIVFTLMMRLVGERDVAEELTLDVFHDVWRQAAQFDAAGGPVLAWLLNLTRFRALEQLERERHSEGEVADVQERAGRLRSAVANLSVNERQLIEAGYFSKRTYRELAQQRNQPPEAVRRDMHIAIDKLRVKLQAAVER